MTCSFCPHKGKLATVTVPGFDGKTVTKVMEICDADAKILQSRTVTK